MERVELRRAVERIVARFLSIGGENEINISAAVRYALKPMGGKLTIE
jgi:hypothetical protein